MEFNTFKIVVFAVLIVVYLTVRKLFKKFADFTEKLGNPTDSSEELKRLNTRIITLEQKINNKQ